jgi:antitoxin component of RelBE/YafQ-DinJ toxin-antitoxin module
MSKNAITKKCLDEYLKKEKNLTFDKTLEIFLEYINLNKRMPTQIEKYKNINIGNWLNSQKMKIKSNEDDIYIKMSKNAITKKCLDEYLNKEKNLTFDETLKIFLEYIDINKKIPTKSEKYKNINISAWLNAQKNKIKSNEDDIYIKMSKNNIIKEYLDDYLKKKNLTFDKTFEIFLEYININKRTPTKSEKYKNTNIGLWLQKQKIKIKIKSNKCDIYIKMSKNNITKECLDDYLKKKNNKINTIKILS